MIKCFLANPDATSLTVTVTVTEAANGSASHLGPLLNRAAPWINGQLFQLFGLEHLIISSPTLLA